MKTVENQNTKSRLDEIKELKDDLASLKKQWAEYMALGDDLGSLRQQLPKIHN